MDFIKKEVVMNDDLDVHAIEVEIDHIKKELSNEFTLDLVCANDIITQQYLLTVDAFLQTFYMILKFYDRENARNSGTHDIPPLLHAFNIWYLACAKAMRELHISIVYDWELKANYAELSVIKTSISNSLQQAKLFTAMIHPKNSIAAGDLRLTVKSIETSFRMLVINMNQVLEAADFPYDGEPLKLVASPLTNMITKHFERYSTKLFVLEPTN